MQYINDQRSTMKDVDEYSTWIHEYLTYNLIQSRTTRNYMHIRVWFISYLTDDRSKHWWIGLNEHLSEGKYIWQGTNRNFRISSDYHNFVGSEPNNQGDENCVEIRQEPNNGFHLGWNDWSCANRAQFICERNGTALIVYNNMHVDDKC